LRFEANTTQSQNVRDKPLQTDSISWSLLRVVL
jgi:hypothetical protein